MLVCEPAPWCVCLQEEVSCVYRVEVQTSDLRKAGTAGSVFLTIIGETCNLGELRRGGRRKVPAGISNWSVHFHCCPAPHST